MCGGTQEDVVISAGALRAERQQAAGPSGGGGGLIATSTDDFLFIYFPHSSDCRIKTGISIRTRWLNASRCLPGREKGSLYVCVCVNVHFMVIRVNVSGAVEVL